MKELIESYWKMDQGVRFRKQLVMNLQNIVLVSEEFVPYFLKHLLDLVFRMKKDSDRDLKLKGEDIDIKLKQIVK